MTTWATADKVGTPLYYWSIWRILAPAAKVFTMRYFLQNSTDPCEAIESWNRSLAQFLDEQEAKQKCRHYPTVTTLPHLTVRCTLMSYAEPYIAMLLSTELHYTQLKYAAFFWANGTLHPTLLGCTLLKYPAPYWTTYGILHPSKLRCTLLSALHSIALQRAIRSYTTPIWAPQHPHELSCTLMS